MRQTENWSKILPHHKFDNRNFNAEEVLESIHTASPKLEQLFHIIAQVDENDMNTHGKYFKHFIFSDVKEGGYGAKILASAFIANGYKNLITAVPVQNQKSMRMTLLKAGEDGRSKSFGLLASTAVFNTEFNQKFKKEVLQLYNKRPDNIQGEEMRFIILDSGYKEGIDLFDVKYVHIFEPSMTIADLKQTIGRATRTCGQKGLVFEPNVGWPLYVYNYYIAVPEEIKENYMAVDDKLLDNPEEERYIFRNTEKLKDTIQLYSQFDRTLTKLAEQLYRLAPIFSVDFPLTQQIHRIHDVAYLYDVTEQGRNASLSASISASNISASNSASLIDESSNNSGGARRAFNDIKCAGKCGLRSTNDIPATVDFLAKVYLKHGHSKANMPDKEHRKYLCDYMKRSPDYCQQVNAEWANRAAMVPDLVYKRAKKAPKATAKPKSKTRRKEPSYMNLAESATPYMTLAAESATPYAKEPSYMNIGESATPYAKEPSYMNIGESATPYMNIGESATPYAKEPS